MGEDDIRLLTVEEHLFLRDVRRRTPRGIDLMGSGRWADLAAHWGDLEGRAMFDVGYASWAADAGARRVVLMSQLQLLVARLQLAAAGHRRHLGPAVDLLGSVTRQGAFAPAEFGDPRVAEVSNANFLTVLRAAQEWGEAVWGPSRLGTLGDRDDTAVAAALGATRRRVRELERRTAA
ncbi:hypothetical protein [Actinomycetospora flava]|uniref:Uncharacterized protein n=1 Tax=Actinomycetospora flava TaxID=3129232 RepID=A0ABU8MCA0_9PSEU